jgi:phosphoacetylglucosamine mutase
MLHESWEDAAEAVVNASSIDELESFLADKLNANSAASGLVFLACDTRESSQRLLSCVQRGVEAVECLADDCGLLSTPALHHIVRHSNNFGTFPTPASEAGYLQTLCEGYLEISTGGGIPLTVDCAGGVGAVLLEKLTKRLNLNNLEICNRPGSIKLNEGCGAEFVQKQRRLPLGISENSQFGASLDGDADRIVFWLRKSAQSWQLLDGDKIAALLGVFLVKQFTALEISPDFVAVQTAYANGASGQFLKDNGIAVKIAKTGVKFVEAVAREHQVGMYFEANGHGTILFRSDLLEIVKNCPQPTAEKIRAAKNILGLAKLLNQAVGDALADLLAVLTVLEAEAITPREWSDCYRDLPSRQGKIVVPDRRAVKCSVDETRVTEPARLQLAIDSLVSSLGGRAFVRPSGTEDALRIYAEAATQKEADNLAFEVAISAGEILKAKSLPERSAFGL